ncbi:MAG: hypothetical protein HON32_09355 [Francisellaceae bacterium]|jgi:hypothetical protein|nr:hypothetical protein [Francisellaceae bacterium]MBT6539398.1 hypothetical protein [Francisellaceae bacterium]
MKPYMLITGNLNGIDEFEDKISSALDDGYDICNNLVVKEENGSTNVILLQAMILEEFEEEEEDELEFEEESELDEAQI